MDKSRFLTMPRLHRDTQLMNDQSTYQYQISESMIARISIYNHAKLTYVFVPVETLQITCRLSTGSNQTLIIWSLLRKSFQGFYSVNVMMTISQLCIPVSSFYNLPQWSMKCKDVFQFGTTLKALRRQKWRIATIITGKAPLNSVGDHAVTHSGIQVNRSHYFLFPLCMQIRNIYGISWWKTAFFIHASNLK